MLYLFVPPLSMQFIRLYGYSKQNKFHTTFDKDTNHYLHEIFSTDSVSLLSII